MPIEISNKENLSDVYSELIIDLYKHPLNKGKLENADLIIESGNPYCGDKIKLYFLFDKEKIKDVKYEAEGCSISNASASLFSQLIKGKSINEVLELTDENIFSLFKAKIISRINCMLLPLNAVKKGLKSYLNSGKKHGLKVTV